MGGDTIEEPADLPTDLESLVDSADDGEETSNATEPGNLAMALRVKTPLICTLTDCYAAETHFKTFQI